MRRQRLLHAFVLLSGCSLWIDGCDREPPAPAVMPPAPPPAQPPQAAPPSTAPSPERAPEALGASASDKVTLGHAGPSATGSADAPLAHRGAETAPAPVTAKHSELPKPESAKPESTKAASPKAEAVKPEPAPAKAVMPEAVQPAPATAAPPPAPKVVVPRTAHVHVDVPKGLQTWLDADTRMQPWVAEVMRVADRCYGQVRASNATAAGAIEVAVTMHKDARPDADILALPPQLSGIVACGTGDLIRSGMPLFTGNEGERYTVRIVFEP